MDSGAPGLLRCPRSAAWPFASHAEPVCDLHGMTGVNIEGLARQAAGSKGGAVQLFAQQADLIFPRNIDEHRQRKAAGCG